MHTRRRRPQWWQLYVGLPLLCSLFVLEINLHLSQKDDTILQLAILGLIFVFIRIWLRTNRGALMELDEDAPERQEQWRVRAYQFPAAEPVTGARSRTVRRPLVHIPQGEIKGVLNTTFEMEAEEPAGLFQPHTEDVLPLEHFHSPVPKE
jgi:hypothetical protein